jgi:rod shape determining protein RodA
MRLSSSSILPKKLDAPLLIIYLIFVFLGVATIFSSAYTEEFPSLFSMDKEYGKQIVYIGFSLFVGMVILLIDGRFFTFSAYYIYGFVMLLLVAVLFTKGIKGAHSWFKVGGFSLQPSELAKFATALAFAKLLTTPNRKITDSRTRLWALLILAIPALLITIQPDPGTVLVFVSFVLVMYREGMSGLILLVGLLVGIVAVMVVFTRDSVWFGFMSGPWLISAFAVLLCAISYVSIAKFVRKRFRRKYFIQTTVVLGVVVLVSFGTLVAHKYLLSDRHRDRFDVILGLIEDNQGVGYNQAQSMAAVASGDLLGKGYGNATMSNDQFNQVPEQSTDFIFCSVGEEWGFVGGLVFICLYVIMLIRIVMIAERQRSQFTRIFGYCAASIFFFHFLINVGMVIGVVPVVGIPLPFFSYGGSSIIGFSILIFILLRLDSERMEVLR